MTNKNRIASMDAVGELPDLGNLLLREGGFPHLPDPAFVPAPKWSDAGTKPDYPCLCETRNENWNEDLAPGYQYWNGEFWGYACEWKDQAIQQGRYKEKMFVVVQWREVQP